MESAFPTGIPTFTDIDPNATLAANNHASRHNQVHAEVTAIAEKVGTNGSSDPTSLEYRLTQAVQALNTANNLITELQADMGVVEGLLPTYATLTGTQTLTGKTIDGDSNTLVDIGTSSLKDGAVTPAKMRPTYATLTTPHNGTGTRTNLSSAGSVPGSSLTYTTGPTAEIIEAFGYGLINGGGGNGLQIRANGTFIGRRTYYHTGGHISHYPKGRMLAAPNTTYTFDLWLIPVGATEICNANSDVNAGFNINLEIIAWGRAA